MVPLRMAEGIVNYDKENEEVEDNGIRCAYDDHRGNIIIESKYDNYNGFIGNEYVISNENQYLPIYGVTFKRVEYLVIWRDYNFNFNNPNNYDQNIFKDMQEFHIKISIQYQKLAILSILL